MKRRTSNFLSCLKSELRRHAIKAKDEETANDYWRMYYKAVNAEQEIVLEAEVRRLLEFIVREGIADGLVDEMQQSDDTADKPQKPQTDTTLTDDDIPPRQKGFWD